jgi:hypothetical protein
VAAHVTIAWVAITVHARRQEVKWSNKVKDEWLPQSEARLKAAIPPAPVLPPIPSLRDIDNVIEARFKVVEQRLDMLPNAEQLAVELVPKVGQVAASMVNQAAPAIIDAAFEKFKSYTVGAAGNAIQKVEGRWGKEALDELAAIDFGNQFFNGMWAGAVKANGPKIMYRLGRVVRRFSTGLSERYGFPDLLAEEEEPERRALGPGEPEVDTDNPYGV